MKKIIYLLLSALMVHAQDLDKLKTTLSKDIKFTISKTNSSIQTFKPIVALQIRGGYPTLHENLIKSLQAVSSKKGLAIYSNGVKILNKKRLAKFYETIGYRGLWQDGGYVSQKVFVFQDMLNYYAKLGFDKEKYHYKSIEEMLQKLSLTKDEADGLDLILTDALLLFAKDLHYGLLNPESFMFGKDRVTQKRRKYLSLNNPKKGLDYQRVLAKLYHQGVEQAIAFAEPQVKEYRHLKSHLDSYMVLDRLAYAWREIAGSPTIKLNRQSKRVPKICERLKILGFLEGTYECNTTVLNKDISKALRSFQQSSGLTPDGSFGAMSAKALNTTPNERIKQIATSMEVWRWFAPHEHERYIVVNIPSFELFFNDDKKIVSRVNVVVGQVNKPTPILSAKMRYIVLNPYWRVPPSIIKHEFLPMLKEGNFDHFNNKNIKLYIDNEFEIEPSLIDWTQVSKESVPFSFRQEPGRANALGKIKFIFPNELNIYLHDTPTKHLFGNTRRAYSHGCIRVSKPFNLAKFVLNDKYSAKELKNILSSKDRKVVHLKSPLPIYAGYWRAFATDKEIKFAEDIYGYEKLIRKRLTFEN